MSAPRVYAAICAVTAELAGTGIAKAHVNQDEAYAYRGIDDVMKRLAPVLARHRLCILPRVLERTRCERHGRKDGLLQSVALKVAFDLVSARDGSLHTVEAYGEALDAGDKATSKAMSAAFKYAMLQAFCVPVEGRDDSDSRSYRLKPGDEQPDPDQGWEQWSCDIQDMVRICESGEALDRVQATYRAMLRAASKRRPDVYAAIGDSIKARRQVLASAAPAPATTVIATRRSANGAAQSEATANA
jgi:hypothetical protein